MFHYETYWDVIEMKFIILFITGALAIVLGNWLYKKSKEK